MVQNVLQESASPGKPKAKGKKTRQLTVKQAEFVRLVVAGSPYGDAYRAAYDAANCKDTTVSVLATRVSRNHLVIQEIVRLRGKLGRQTLLTLNQRLSILGGIIASPESSPNEVAYATAVYSRISGDLAPDRHEHAGPGGGPIPIASSAAPAVRRLPLKERLAAMRLARAAPAALPAPVAAAISVPEGLVAGPPPENPKAPAIELEVCNENPS